MSSLVLNSQAPASNPQVPASNPKAPARDDVELQFWDVVKDSDQAAAFRAYLLSYPNGQFRSQALARIAALEGGPPGSKPAAPATGIDDPQKQSPPASPELPEFPWPPPAPSSYYVLPNDLLRARQTVGEAADAIIAALESTGYVERTFFRTSQGGVALVTRLERFMPDGSPGSPERWSINGGAYRSAADIAKFLRGLFFVEEGHYRLIVFIMQKDIFIPSNREMAEPEARSLIKRGANDLPAATRKQTFDGNHCTVLIYEFSSDGKAVRFVAQSSLPAKEHLAKAGVLASLGKGK